MTVRRSQTRPGGIALAALDHRPEESDEVVDVAVEGERVTW